MSLGTRAVFLLGSFFLLAPGCGDSGDADGASATGAAKVTGPVTGGMETPYSTSRLAFGLKASDHGYIEEEFFVEGTATTFGLVGTQTMDGKWTVTPGAEAPYKTRIVVRRPADAAKFNGTALVEWLNVSGGIDADVDFMMGWEEILRGGYVYVAVSAQSTGIEAGGIGLGSLVGGGNRPDSKPLKEWDPARYASLAHPGDDYSFDIFSQVGELVAKPGKKGILGGLEPKRVLALGESQSAGRMVTYVNAVHPIANIYDGFLIHSRSAGGAALTNGGGIAGLIGFVSGSPVLIRDDLTVPVVQAQSETDVNLYLGARQPDTERLQTWEMAGTAHADRRFADTESMGIDLGCGMVNDGPQHFLIKALIRSLHLWVANGTAPAKAPRIEVANGAIVRDELGNAKGGIRTPYVDVPIAVNSGEPDPATSGTNPGASGGGALGGLLGGGNVVCSLFGHTKPFTPEQLATLYPTHQEYVDKVTSSAASTRTAGFLLAEDEATMVADARAAPVPR
ncbi:MAG: alpha/beta hydrolase domain-containing protein [Polyangiales bacterium]